MLRAALFVPVVCAILLVGANEASAQHNMGPSRPIVATPEGRHADIAAFRQEFLTHDKSYSTAARAEAEQRLTRLDRDADHVSQAYFDLEIARIVALADNGHTLAIADRRSAAYNRVPIRFEPFGEEFYVLWASDENADILGARLVSIDRHSIAQLRTAARSLMGGTNGHRDREASSFFESPEQLAALHLSAETSAATYMFELRSGARVSRRLTGAAPSQERPSGPSWRWYFADFAPDHWRSALQASAAPWSLTEPMRRYRWRAAPELDALVIEFRQNVDMHDGQTLNDFMAEVRAKITELHPRNLVVDQRQNSGGNLQITRDFMEALPTLAPGRIFVLTSPSTFSAAISSTAYLKQAGGDRVTIVGEDVGDRMMFFAEGDVITLSNSQAMMLYADERHDYATGCSHFTDCHRAVVQHPISLPTLAPDIAAPWTIDDYLAGRDPGIDAVARAVGRPGS